MTAGPSNVTVLLRRLIILGALTIAIALPIVSLVMESAAYEISGQVGPGLDLFTIAIGILGISAVSVGVVIRWRRPGNLIGAMLLVGALLLSSTILG